MSFERWTNFLHDESERLRKEKRSENPDKKSERYGGLATHDVLHTSRARKTD